MTIICRGLTIKYIMLQGGEGPAMLDVKLQTINKLTAIQNTNRTFARYCQQQVKNATYFIFLLSFTVSDSEMFFYDLPCISS